MTRMVRKQIYIEPRQEAMLERMARESGTTQAELIREAIDQRMTGALYWPRDLNAWELESEFIRSLIKLGPVPGGRSWRREDLYDRQNTGR